MPEALVALLLILFFTITSFKDFSTATPVGVVRGIISLLIAVAIIYGNSGF